MSPVSSIRFRSTAACISRRGHYKQPYDLCEIHIENFSFVALFTTTTKNVRHSHNDFHSPRGIQ